MPGFQDSAIIIFLALLLFGPKKLPELARQLGKLMAEFRRASNEFRIQMEDELRASEQEEQRKKIDAMQAAAPIAPPSTDPALPAETEAAPQPVHDTTLETAVPSETAATSEIAETASTPPLGETAPVAETSAPEPLPIATSGELKMMPPSTGLPLSNQTLSPVLESIPHDPAPAGEEAASEATQHG